MTMPLSQSEVPATLWPVPRMATNRSWGASKVHRVDHVGDAGAANNEIRAPVDHRIVDLAGRIVTGIAGKSNFPPDLGRKIFDGRGI